MRGLATVGVIALVDEATGYQRIREKRALATILETKTAATHHQWFTPDLGHPKLKEYLAAVIALMKASSNWNTFICNLNRAFPKSEQQLELLLDG